MYSLGGPASIRKRFFDPKDISPMTTPRRRKSVKRARRPKRDAGPKAPATSSNLDLAVLRALILLSTADCLEFADHQWPPKEICRWLEQADLREVRGLLLATLERWRGLHRSSGDA
jgi:hypothetical protein